MRRAVAVMLALAALVATGWSWLRPPSFDAPRLWAWAQAMGPERSVALALWLAAVALGGYLTLVGVAVGICRCFGMGRAASALVGALPGPFRLVLCSAIGLSAVAPGVTASAAAPAVPGPPTLRPAEGHAVDSGAPVLRRLPDGVSALLPRSAPASGPALRPASQPAPAARPDGPASQPAPAARPDGQASRPAPAAHPALPAPPAPRTWVIRPGDHLWLVAQQTLTTAWGGRADTRAIARYWWTLVEMNRPHLPDPDNPDLVFPGDVITLPPIPAD